MRAQVEVVLVDGDPEMIAAWERAFADRPEVEVRVGALTDTPAAAWVTETHRGELDPALVEALGAEVEAALRQTVREGFGGSLPADFAVWVPTGREAPAWLVATSGAPKNPEGVDDPMRVALGAGAALQAVHMHGGIDRIALPPLGPASVGADARAELMWTAYALFRDAELPDFPTMRRAIAGLLVGVDRSQGEGAYKRTFGVKRSRDSVKSTLPDKSAANAQLRKKLAAVRDDE